MPVVKSQENREDRCRMSLSISMRRILRAILIVSGLTFLLPSAWADSPSSFILVQCMGSINRLEISTFMTWNVCDDCERAATLVKQGLYELGDFIQRYSK